MRCCAGGVGVCEALVNRQMTIEGKCWRCGSVMESVEHVLMYCLFARVAWLGFVFSFVIPPTDFLTFHQWIDKLATNVYPSKAIQRKAVSFVAFMCWYLWKARNDFYFDNVNSSPSNVIRCADRAWHDYFNAIESNAS
ncbi:hypothetical protein NE237_030064 [Protea cynaroides]|uniref:Reverse transcriptase zinc-binding domain-containing protein n=1 Tax=Protea cynaroides TaxID=273540 RepID=A0A9Q0GWG4_9MAGN|nr:hypothetical protein NE237_030064 [Protea cynaroides]